MLATKAERARGKKRVVDDVAPAASVGGKSDTVASFAAPAWIDMPSARALKLKAKDVVHWESSAGGTAAARRGDELNSLRLMGSVALTFSLPGASGGDEALAKALGLMEKPVKPRVTHAKWYRGRGGSSREPSPETWNQTNGEFSGQGYVSPASLMEAELDGTVLCEQEWGTEVLQAIKQFTSPDPGLWGCPLIRVVIPPPAHLHEAATMTKRGSGDKAKAKRARTDGMLTLTAHVYASRLLLYMIAHPSIRVLLTHMSIAGGIRRPLDELPSYPQCYLSHGGAAAPPFSLEGLLKGCEHKGYREASQPRGVALALKRYQAQALAWMIDMEALPRGINGLFWEERKFKDGGSYYYSPQLGEMRLEEPPMMHGGLLCDEMGLGKTLELVSLIVATLDDKLPKAPGGLISSRATLIVVPVPLVSQWMAEIGKSVGKGSPLTYRKYTSDDLIKRDQAGAWHARAVALAEHDIIITTYPAMEKCAVLPQIAWKRVVLDEMQEVRSSTTELARKCEKLYAPRRWMVSGTPLYDKISDLQGELYFLRVSPFGAGHEDGFWRHVIGDPWHEKDESALDALQVLLNGVMMRHSKTQTWLDGTTILSLPPRRLVMQPVALEGSEHAAYVWLEQLITREVARTRALQEASTAERTGSRSSGGALLVTGLRLLREASVALQLVAGGGGVAEQLKALEEIARAQLQATYGFGASASPQMDLTSLDEVQLTQLTPSQALMRLGSQDRMATEAQHTSSLYNAQHRGDMVRHASQKQRVYDRSRSYALEGLQEKFNVTERKKEELEQEAQAERWLTTTRRWQWALERVTTGGILCRANQNAPGDDEATAAMDVEGAPRLGGKLGWLWLFRASILHVRAERLRLAEEELAEAEGSVMAAVLTLMANGKYKNTSGEQLSVLAAPLALRAPTTEQDKEFNKGQLRGHVGKDTVVVVDGFKHGELQDRDEGEEAADEVDDDGSRFVSVAASEVEKVPAGWVHNKRIVQPKLLALACKRLGVPFDAKRILAEKEKVYRTQLFRIAFAPLRTKRDEAQQLCRGVAIPAVYGKVALRRLVASDALGKLGGGATLRAVQQQLASGTYTTTAELVTRVRGALVAAAQQPRVGNAEAKRAATAEAEKATATLREYVDAAVGAVGPIGWRPTKTALAEIRAKHADEWTWLKTSTLQLRGLPASATTDDLERCLAPFKSGGLAKPVVTLDGKGVALVDLGAEEGVTAALREATSSSKGLQLQFASEAAVLAKAVADAEAEVARLSKTKGKGDAAKAKELLASKKKKLSELRLGRRAWLDTTGRASKGLLADEAHGVAVEPCGRFRTEQRTRPASQVLPELLREATAAGARLRDAEHRLQELQPYVNKLQSAIELGLDADVVEQSGFQDIFSLEQGRKPAGSCPICYERVGNECNVVVTPCAHLFCKTCLLQWMRAQNVMMSAHELAMRHGMGEMSKLCPCCRHPFTQSKLIEILPVVEKEAGEGGSGSSSSAGAGPSGAARAAAAGSSSDGAGCSTDPMVVEDDADASAGGSDEPVPRYSAAHTVDAFQALPAAGGGHPPLRVLRYPSIAPAFLAHVQAATGLPPAGSARLPSAESLPSAKVRRLLADLEALGNDANGVPKKAVVFSSHKTAVKHLDFVLARAGVPHVTIVKGDAHAHLETAVGIWTSRPSCRVFLLHAGAAAAGLTLVAAQHVFLMEPFATPGQELQALNRCHRIGQTLPVTCTTYYCENTVEERLLAFRQLENAEPGAATDGDEAEAEAVSVLPAESGGSNGGRSGDSAASRAEAMLSPRKLRFVLGMLSERDTTAQQAAEIEIID